MPCSHEEAKGYQVHYFSWLIPERLTVKYRQLPSLMLWAACLAPAPLQHREYVFTGKEGQFQALSGSQQPAGSLLENFKRLKGFHCTTDTNNVAEDTKVVAALLHQLSLFSFPHPRKDMQHLQNLHSYPLWLWIAHFTPPESSALLGPGFSIVKNIKVLHVYCIHQKVVFAKIFFSCTIDWNRIDMHNRQEIFFFQEISIYEINTKHASNVPYLRL